MSRNAEFFACETKMFLSSSLNIHCIYITSGSSCYVMSHCFNVRGKLRCLCNYCGINVFDLVSPVLDKKCYVFKKLYAVSM